MGIIDDLFNEAMAFNMGGGCDMPGNESVTYLPYPSGSRTITVNVTRQTPQPIPGMEQASVPDITLFIARHATLGTTAINLQGDKVRMKLRIGDSTTQDLPITQLIGEDAAGFTVKVG